MPSRQSTTLRLTAPAKINIGLWVRRRRSDGFHDLETLFYPIPLHDTLTVRLYNGPDRLRCATPGIPTDHGNLALQAVQALRIHWGADAPTQGFDIHLQKRIPAEGGLGGGSSDAGALLRGIPDWVSLPVKHRALRQIAMQLGSDVPFFCNPRFAVARGRGERLRSLSWKISGYLALVLPAFGVSTAWAFSKVQPRGMEGPSLADVLRPVLRWQRPFPSETPLNDFDDIVYKRHTSLRMLRDTLLTEGAAIVSLSGTGSTLYGLFQHKNLAENSVRRMRQSGHTVRLISL